MFERRIGEDPHRRDYGRTKQGQKVGAIVTEPNRKAP